MQSDSAIKKSNKKHNKQTTNKQGKGVRGCAESVDRVSIEPPPHPFPLSLLPRPPPVHHPADLISIGPVLILVVMAIQSHLCFVYLRLFPEGVFFPLPEPLLWSLSQNNTKGKQKFFISVMLSANMTPLSSCYNFWRRGRPRCGWFCFISMFAFKVMIKMTDFMFGTDE